MPVPLKDADCIEPVTPLALSVTVNEPESAPVDCGSKVTLIVHEDDAASEVPQLFV